jgi:hypothetical protein
VKFRRNGMKGTSSTEDGLQLAKDRGQSEHRKMAVRITRG